MEQGKSIHSKMLTLAPIDQAYEVEEHLEKCYKKLVGQIANLSESQAHDLMNAQATQSTANHEQIQMGLLYSVLTNTSLAVRSYRDMAYTNKDGFQVVLLKMNQMVYEKWPKLNDVVSKQIIWFLHELIKNKVQGAEALLLNLLRNIAGGDISQKNIWLAESLLNILSDTAGRAFLEKYPFVYASVVYRYLRVMEDHHPPALQYLRQREAEFVDLLLREKWQECIMALGRDLSRMLQNVGHLPVIERLWHDIIHNPSTLDKQFTGLQQLLGIRTSRKVIVNLLTPEMENKICWLVTKVRFGHHKRYQEWFQKQFLSTPESQSLRCDMIRYICLAIHPTNEQLCSDVIPRWAVIGWLLTTCTSNVASSNSKMALFYDWLRYDDKVDNIMNIEPGILVMYYSLRSHPTITATLLDFLCRIIPQFHPPLGQAVKEGVVAAFRAIVAKKVVPSMPPLFESPKLDPDLVVVIRDTFPEFCAKEEPPATNGRDLGDMDGALPPRSGSISDVRELRGSISGVSDIAEFSDVEDDEEEDDEREIEEKPSVLGMLKKELGLETNGPSAPGDISGLMTQLEGRTKEALLELRDETDKAAQCEAMDGLVQALMREDYPLSPVASCLAVLLQPYFSEKLFPADPCEESLEDSIGSPLFVIFRTLCQLPTEDPNRQELLTLLGQLHAKQPSVGFYLLYFLKVSKGTDDRITVYKDFCQTVEDGALTVQLIKDLRLCRDSDAALFTFLLPDVYSQFSSVACGNTDLLHLIVSSIDASQLRDLMCEILQGHLTMFTKESLTSVLNTSLEWETLEQHFLWQLLLAQALPVENMMAILPRLEWSAHSEALANILVQLKMEVPCLELLRPLLARPCRQVDLLTVSVLKTWADENDDKLADHLTSLLLKAAGLSKKRHNRNNDRDKGGPSVEQILAHLEHLRLACKNISFLMNETLQQTLQQVQGSCADSIKARYSDLFALAEDSGGGGGRRTLRGLPSRKALAAEKAMAAAAGSRSGVKGRSGNGRGDSGGESSSDEEIVPRKKKKLQATVDDDSD